MAELPATLMRFAWCEHCNYRERLADDAAGVPRMCNGCGHFGSYKFVGVTMASVARQLLPEFPEPGPAVIEGA